VQDAKVVDNACLALSRIAEAFAHRPASLNMLCEFGLISNAVQLVRILAVLMRHVAEGQLCFMLHHSLRDADARATASQTWLILMSTKIDVCRLAVCLSWNFFVCWSH